MVYIRPRFLQKTNSNKSSRFKKSVGSAWGAMVGLSTRGSTAFSRSRGQPVQVQTHLLQEKVT